MTSRSIAAAVFALSLGAIAVAQPLETRPDAGTIASTNDNRPELASVLPQSRLIGKTRLTVWGFQVYDARLWAAPDFKADKPNGHPFALELTYLRAFDSQDIAVRSIAEMRRSATVNETQAKTRAELTPDGAFTCAHRANQN